MSKSVTTYEKPTSHIGLADWYATQWELEKSAESRKSDAFDFRSSGRRIRSETQIKTEWDTRMNNFRLANRVTELSSWENLFQSLLERLEAEIYFLKDEKADAERELENFHAPLQVIAQCLSMRDCRRGNELTYDEVDVELKKELCVLEGSKKILMKRVQAAWEKLNRLQQVKFKVNLDLQNKHETLEIDRNNLKLDHTCAIIKYKPNVLRNQKNLISYEVWLEQCQHIKLLADNELSDVYSFRESIRTTRERIRNDIRAQQDFTDFTLRKRIHQIQKARNELDWQKLKIQKEMDALQVELIRLDEALLTKTNAIKCAETRLENRSCRPGIEMCQDESQIGLQNEIFQLRQTKQDLIEKIKSAKATYNGLESFLIRINKNLDDKQHSLMTDIRCFDIRTTLKTGNRTGHTNETDRNIILTRMEKEIPPEN